MDTSIKNNHMHESSSNDSLSLLRNSLCSFSFLNNIDLTNSNINQNQNAASENSQLIFHNNSNNNPLLSHNSYNNDSEEDDINWDNLL